LPAGIAPAVVARILRISRQALYRVPAQRPAACADGLNLVDGRTPRAIVEVAEANPTDGYRSSLPG